MDVRFYFDPVCPWCWLTSRWIARVAPHRGLVVDWRPVSLEVRNEGREVAPELVEPMRRGFELLRVVEAMRAAGAAGQVGDLYRELGRRIHNEGSTDVAVRDALAAAGIDESFADAAKDPRWDDAVRASTAEAVSVAGEDVGTPIIAVEAEPGRWTGFFGPVLTRMPEGDEAVRLWDGFAAMATVPGVWEVKRSRTEHPALPPID